MSWAGLDDFLSRATQRLDPVAGEAVLPVGGETDLADEIDERLRPAAVLMGIVPRASGPTMVLTLRPTTMAEHAGQVAFPGGKIDREDSNAAKQTRKSVCAQMTSR